MTLGYVAGCPGYSGSIDHAVTNDSWTSRTGHYLALVGHKSGDKQNSFAIYQFYFSRMIIEALFLCR